VHFFFKNEGYFNGDREDWYIGKKVNEFSILVCVMGLDPLPVVFEQFVVV